MNRGWTRRVASVTAMAASAGLLAACGSGDSSDEVTSGADGTAKVVLGSPVPDSVIGYEELVASELGFFEEEGLELEYAPASEELSGAALLDNGSVDVASLGASEVIFASQKGIETLRVPFDSWTRTAEGVVTPADSEIETLADLEGQKVGLVSAGEDGAFLSAALEEVGLSRDDVETTVVGQGGPAVAAALESGEFAAFGGAISDFSAVQANGLELRDITPESMANIPAAAQTVSAEALESNEKGIVGYLRAVAKGIHLGQARPEVVEAITRETAPQDWRDEAVAKALLENTIDSTEPLDPERIGVVDVERWQAAQDQLIAAGELSAEVDLDAVLVTDLIEQINDFDRAEVEQVADDWMKENGG